MQTQINSEEKVKWAAFENNLIGSFENSWVSNTIKTREIDVYWKFDALEVFLSIQFCEIEKFEMFNEFYFLIWA